MASTHQYRRYARLVLAMLLAAVMCWVGDRTGGLPPVASSDGPTLERSAPDTCPVGKLADSSSEAGEKESADDSDGATLFVCAATIEFVGVVSVGQFAHGRELNDWRARSSIGARGPPIG